MDDFESTWNEGSLYRSCHSQAEIGIIVCLIKQENYPMMTSSNINSEFKKIRGTNSINCSPISALPLNH